MAAGAQTVSNVKKAPVKKGSVLVLLFIHHVYKHFNCFRSIVGK